MPNQTVDISACMPVDPDFGMVIRIKIGSITYDIWATWNNTSWVVSLDEIHGATIVDISACMPSSPSIHTTYVINGVSYHYSTSDSKWHCGA